MKRWIQFIPLIIFFYLGNPSGNAQDTLLYASLPAGIKAPCIKGKNENGKNISLAKIKSRYILLYFYELHCHLCEAITPELKNLYDAYHKIGLEIIAVPLESEKGEWINHVKENQLRWINLYPALKDIGKLKADYKLTVSPTFYLIDRNKILLTQRMGRLEQVTDELNLRIR